MTFQLQQRDDLVRSHTALVYTSQPAAASRFARNILTSSIAITPAGVACAVPSASVLALAEFRLRTADATIVAVSRCTLCRPPSEKNLYTASACSTLRGNRNKHAGCNAGV